MTARNRTDRWQKACFDTSFFTPAELGNIVICGEGINNSGLSRLKNLGSAMLFYPEEIHKKYNSFFGMHPKITSTIIRANDRAFLQRIMEHKVELHDISDLQYLFTTLHDAGKTHLMEEFIQTSAWPKEDIEHCLRHVKPRGAFKRALQRAPINNPRAHEDALVRAVKNNNIKQINDIVIRHPDTLYGNTAKTILQVISDKLMRDWRFEKTKKTFLHLTALGMDITWTIRINPFLLRSFEGRITDIINNTDQKDFAKQVNDARAKALDRNTAFKILLDHARSTYDVTGIQKLLDFFPSEKKHGAHLVDAFEANDFFTFKALLAGGTDPNAPACIRLIDDIIAVDDGFYLKQLLDHGARLPREKAEMYITQLSERGTHTNASVDVYRILKNVVDKDEEAVFAKAPDIEPPPPSENEVIQLKAALAAAKKRIAELESQLKPRKLDVKKANLTKDFADSKRQQRDKNNGNQQGNRQDRRGGQTSRQKNTGL